jgi:hypothetical protein
MGAIRDAVVIDGQCEDKFWPNGHVKPTIKIEEIDRVYRLDSGQVLPISLDDLSRFISEGQALVLGLYLNFAFILGKVRPISVGPKGEGLFGLHAVLVVGYDDPGQFVTVKNSWGPDWGEGGYGRLSYDYVERYGTEMLGLNL